MPKSVNQKQKLLFLLDYLRQNTDETHTVTTPQIIDHLAANGIRAERKSIYNDIQTLCDYGYDIIRTEGAHAGYRIADRTFELPEVKLLVDLVQSSKFITTKKSRQLIGKLEQEIFGPPACLCLVGFKFHTGQVMEAATGLGTVGIGVTADNIPVQRISNGGYLYGIGAAEKE